MGINDIGVPGYYIICGNGHIIGIIEDDLSWNEDLFNKLEELEDKNCIICGEMAKYKFCHYGNINDCTTFKLSWNSNENRLELSEEQKKLYYRKRFYN
jgi:hypothetical protein